MTLQDLITLTEDSDLSKSYPKADGNYIWDYKITGAPELQLIVSNSGKAGFKDKVSVQELINYVLDETDPQIPGDLIISQMKIVGAEGITIAKV